MSEKNRRWDPLLKEIDDVYVQENFYRLKQYLDGLVADGLLGVGSSGGNTTIINSGTSGDANLTKVMGCAASVVVGNWVYQDDTQNNFAIAAVDNNPAKPVIGLVISKPNAIQCQVLYMGIADVTSTRGNIFLGTAGETTITPPTLGYIQRLGISFGDGQILVRPDFTRVRKI